MSTMGGFDTFSVMSAIFPVFFLLVLGIILFTIAKSIGQWNRNNHQPRLSVRAKVVAKRGHISHSSHNMNDSMHHSSTTTYYVTFEVESGDRMEFHVPSGEYEMLVEGDVGALSFQGTRYLSFERSLNS